ncbi:hypothetical protein ISN44_As06g046690 [Arabidopsis suecica]|uniref:Uncharacterized protein n=1 Tax=Arabidopsis suecica TaxID=45249 RepID=A0A8T2CSD1_ARASU|nr:hypothetical protein ISN44_As06g046690 [Arabidopsis suecica]
MASFIPASVAYSEPLAGFFLASLGFSSEVGRLLSGIDRITRRWLALGSLTVLLVPLFVFSFYLLGSVLVVTFVAIISVSFPTRPLSLQFTKIIQGIRDFS